MSVQNLRNIAIIAHVDHGKTTLVDKLLRQSQTLDQREQLGERIMDSNDLERERGITILAKNTAIRWTDARNGTEYRINIVDTPGHADFGGEVERVLSMVDCVLLLVDSVDGPMPQTRFVTQKAFAMGLRPIVVLNKIDRPGARPDWVVDQVFELFDKLGATDEQLDFPFIYASGLNGYAGDSPDIREGDMTPLFQTIVDKVSPPDVDPEGAFQMQITSLAYSSYVGVIGTGRVKRGRVRANMPVAVVARDGSVRQGRVLQVLAFMGLDKHEAAEAEAGDIIAVTGIEDLGISETVCDAKTPEALPMLQVDEPTMSMIFEVNKSPFAGKEGKFVTSRQIGDRLQRELRTNVALRVEPGESPDQFRVSGRGLLHLGVLLENMRREGYEVAVARPQVILKEVDGEICEPYETLVADVEEADQGGVIQGLAERGGKMQNMVPDGKGRVRLEYIIPSRGLIGFQTQFLTMTSGTGLLFHNFDHFGPKTEATDIGQRHNGVMIANEQGKVLAYALFNLQERGRMMVSPGDEVYEGQVVGIHSRDNDLVVNVLKGKKLTNVRAAGSDENVILTPAVKHSLEQALEFINDDELVELTPESVRVRKKFLKEHERKRADRAD
ncbi:MAG: translational GTPase TypA [Sinimarinibacterium flocculans]|uniref:Large ribosomal subunit assembly factor BipA n=1 Tax=Sinimarinibacterium flocculans TaxID=985250 RepID=A0A318EAJ7_9GAMM|nr:translational GTPase TypA [Sinimarinibacterium flocculans]MEC9361652.1 translational GTPase TypA [Pseudomonadota bacterium]PXV66534.1 GTP-binding protein TypA/BipA [Sinimarinibacterium flocculans]